MEEKTSNRAVVALLCCDHLMKNRIMVVISCSISIRLLVVVVHISFSSSEEADKSLLFLLLLLSSRQNTFFSLFFWGKYTRETENNKSKTVQQQPDLDSTLRLLSILTALGASAALDGGPTRFLISAAIVMNACSTLVAFLADVSRNGMPSWFAYSCGLGKITD